MDKKKTALVAGGIGIVLFLLWRRSRRSVSVSSEQIGETVPEEGMNIPGYRGGDFVSDIDVIVNPSLLGFLNYKMMPLYGFVGTTTIKVPVPVYVREATNYCGPPNKPNPNDMMDQLRYVSEMRQYQANPKYWCRTSSSMRSGSGTSTARETIRSV